MSVVVTGVLIFFIALLTLYLIRYAYNQIRFPDRKTIIKRLETNLSHHEGSVSSDIEKKISFSNISIFNHFLRYVRFTRSLEKLRYQAGSNQPTGFFVLLIIVLALLGYITSRAISNHLVLSTLIAVLVGILPLVYLKIKKDKRMKKFLTQFPDALDMISRALRAGHALTTGMKLVADEFDEPLGPEIRRTLDEINLGADVKDSLLDLSLRIDCPDLKFFVVSVILQRETGGNLSEILDNISHIIRERFTLYGKIRTLTAEGRLSAYILCAIPFVIIAAFYFLNPDLTTVLFTTPEGKIIITVSLTMILCGIFLIFRIVRIKV